MSQYSAIIVAGGKGTRFMSDVPKQFLLLNGKPVLMHTIQRFYEYNHDMQIIVVLPAKQTDYWQSLCKKHNFSIPHTVVNGGDTRTESVINGLRHVPDHGWVAVHDGVRPLVTADLIGRCFGQAGKTGCAIPTLPATDTLRHITGRLIDRSSVLMVQTPQVFDSELLKKAYSNISKQSKTTAFTDDASVFETAGNSLTFIDGERNNIKITTPFDLVLAEAICSIRKS